MYEFENDDMIDYEGVSLQGYVESTYDDLVEVFGDPTLGEDMSDAKWILQFKVPIEEGESYSEDVDYVTATRHKIDEWDDDNIPDGIYRWHVSGFDDDATHCVRKLLGIDDEE